MRNKQIGLQDSSEFFNLGMWKEKDRTVKIDALAKEAQNNSNIPTKITLKYLSRGRPFYRFFGY
jgi:hypothetical protein